MNESKQVCCPYFSIHTKMLSILFRFNISLAAIFISTENVLRTTCQDAEFTLRITRAWKSCVQENNIYEGWQNSVWYTISLPCQIRNYALEIPLCLSLLPPLLTLLLWCTYIYIFSWFERPIQVTMIFASLYIGDVLGTLLCNEHFLHANQHVSVHSYQVILLWL